MSMEFKNYKEMFDDVQLSEDKKIQIEQAMVFDNSYKKRFSLKKFVVLATCMITVLSCVCIAGAQIAKSRKEVLEEKGDIITYESRAAHVLNKITADTKSITIIENGMPMEWPINIDEYVDEEGNIDLEQIKLDFDNDYIDYYRAKCAAEGKSSYSVSIDSQIDEKGNIYAEVWTSDDPTTSGGWYYAKDDGPWHLVVPENAKFADDIELVSLSNGEKGIPLPEHFTEDSIYYFDFTFNGEEYVVAALGDFSVEIIRKHAE